MLLNLSNDYWSRSVQAEKQHYQLAVFRAVENRRPLLRSTNSGITCLVTPDGETHGVLDTFVEAWGIYDVPIYEKSYLTFYTSHPDLFGKIFAWGAHLSILAIISYRLISNEREKRRKKREEEDRLSSLFSLMDERVEC